MAIALSLDNWQPVYLKGFKPGKISTARALDEKELCKKMSLTAELITTKPW